jgi:2-polyprenyl-3-methyl-5-hydroxy-6-metoxy-1,4-benzoquinol methylase
MGELQADFDPCPAELAELIGRRRAELGARFPRIALFFFEPADVGALRKTLERIPEPLRDAFAEVVVVPDPESEGGLASAWDELSSAVGARLRLHRSAGDHGYGGARKAAFDYALQQGFDHVVAMRADGRHPPEALAQLLDAALSGGEQLVVASRPHRSTGGSGTSLARALGRLVAARVQNHVLGIRLRDYDSGYRLYSARALRAVPFQLDSSDRTFDVDLLIQHRALGLRTAEVAVFPAWREVETAREELAHALRACVRAVGYRLHQLHVIRRGRYFVDRGVHYTLKESETGSHMQILDTIVRGRRVLDLGCSQGLLARPLREKQVRVTGVDARPPERLAEELEAYYQRDLELPLELPTGRVFDYVVVADVIEHLRNRAQLLRSARRYLKPGGLLIVSTPNIALWFYRLSLLVGRFEYGPRGVLDRTHVHLYTRDSFRREVEGAGFHVLRERVTALPFEVVFESTGRSRLIRSAARLYHRIARLWPEMFAYQLILEAEIRILDEEPDRGEPAGVA